jgi:hypothetical protein
MRENLGVAAMTDEADEVVLVPQSREKTVREMMMLEGAVVMVCEGGERELRLARVEQDQTVLLAQRWLGLELRVAIEMTVLPPATSSLFLTVRPLGSA